MLPGLDGRLQVIGGPACMAEISQLSRQHLAGHGSLRLVPKGQRLLVTADRLPVLTEPALHHAQGADLYGESNCRAGGLYRTPARHPRQSPNPPEAVPTWPTAPAVQQAYTALAG